MDMDASSLEVLFDPSKCSKLSLDQKRELVYQMSKWADGATDILHSWTRQEILQILCAELGKERKYTGLTKSKIIEHLLKIMEKRSRNQIIEELPLSENSERTSKRQRKSDHPNHLPTASTPEAEVEVVEVVMVGTPSNDTVVYCKNSACQAKMNNGDEFCQRCSCCICHQFDDNKDPSLWLVCNPDPPFHGTSCGMSCHIECALKHDVSGISEDMGLDGSFNCASCGKTNELLGSWRKQLVVARDTRRVDILGYRLSLAQKILAGTQLYKDLCGGVDEAVKLLEEEVGPLTGSPAKMARGIVNRLSSGPEIQRLCASAVKSLDLVLSKPASNTTPSDLFRLDCSFSTSTLVRIQGISASSLSVILSYDYNSNSGNIDGYILWHRKADDKDYPSDPTCWLSPPSTMFILSDLTPATDYLLKFIVLDKDSEKGSHEIPFRTGDSKDGLRNLISNSPEADISQSPSPATNCSSLSNPSSVEDETNNVIPGNDTKTTKANLHKETNGERIELEPKRSTGLECVPYVNNISEAQLQLTPSKITSGKNENARKNSKRQISGKTAKDPEAGSSSKKTSAEENGDGECDGVGGDKDFEYYVKVIRRLECEGHIEADFRRKFLTWYSLRATPQEVRVVKVFVDTFIEDLESLAGQIVDTFKDAVLEKRHLKVSAGFCSKLWH